MFWKKIKKYHAAAGGSDFHRVKYLVCMPTAYLLSDNSKVDSMQMIATYLVRSTSTCQSHGTIHIYALFYYRLFCLSHCLDELHRRW
jgi:hypothetical protein